LTIGVYLFSLGQATAHKPTVAPTRAPTKIPTLAPTNQPTNQPTNFPTSQPTSNPTNQPTNEPTSNPTVNPTESPTESPTNEPTSNPTVNPTNQPTESPTSEPTNEPTANPTVSPTNSPTNEPTILITQNLNFDDFVITDSFGYVTLVIPYDGFTFTGSPTSVVGWPYPGIWVGNTTIIGLPSFTNALSTPPNMIWTQGENLLVYQYNGQGFSLSSFTMATIYDPANQPMFINAYSDLNQQNLLYTTIITCTRTPHPLSFSGWNGIVSLLIGCTNPSTATCNFVVFDTFVVTHN
jgi:hypothetical protein